MPKLSKALSEHELGGCQGLGYTRRVSSQAEGSEWGRVTP